MTQLYKHVITIWSETGADIEIKDLAQAATDGDSYCAKHAVTLIDDPGSDPDWDGTEFFGDVDQTWRLG
jgi:hypothetical protein